MKNFSKHCIDERKIWKNNHLQQYCAEITERNTIVT